jgi:virulence factor Mce-like protein
MESRGDLVGARQAYGRSDERGDGLGAFKLGMLFSRIGDWEAAKDAWRRADERGHHGQASDVVELIARGKRRPSEAPGPIVSGRPASALTNPVLIGAVTVLIALVAVFLAYNANQGLPFVPTRELKVNIADGSNLVLGNDVREGGFRIGLISDMRPVQLPSGQVGALLVLKLQNKIRVPVDSRMSIRPRSLLGLKYVDLQRGSSSRVFADGGTLPISQTSVPVQFDDIFKTFDPKTRAAVRASLTGYGDAFAGRGSALNDTIHSLSPLFLHLEPVARYLSDPGTGLTRFLSTLDTLTGAVSPVAPVFARLFTDTATTFEAISRSPSALQATISESPPTLNAATDSLKAQRPFLADLTTLGSSLTPATAELARSLPDINPAIEAGTVTLAKTPVLNANLQRVMSELKALALAPETNVSLNGLADTVSTLNPMIRYLGPYQTVCDSWNYWWTYLSDHVSEKTGYGTAQRILVKLANPLQPNNLGFQGASLPVNGGGIDSPLGGNAYYHSQNYGAAIDNAGNADCETGQRGYPKKLNYFDPLGRNLATDSHTPGNQGPTFSGRPRVPAGETFSRNPQTGPQLAYNPTNP